MMSLRGVMHTSQSPNSNYLMQTSVYSTSTMPFNRTGGDQYLGTLNNFVDTKISTLQVLMQEKRRMQLLIEEQKMILKSTKLDKINQLKQEDLFKQELQMARNRQLILKEQSNDLSYQITLINEKQQEKAEEYRCTFNEVEEDLEEKKEQVKNFDRDCQSLRHQEHEIKANWAKEIQILKGKNKKADEELQVFREYNDRVCNNEKQRVQFMKNKENDVLKAIQYDRVNSQQTLFKERSKTPVNQLKNEKQQYQRSSSQLGIQANSIQANIGSKSTKPFNQKEQPNSISPQLQSYMDKKLNAQFKNQHISLISNESQGISHLLSVSNRNEPPTRLDSSRDQQSQVSAKESVRHLESVTSTRTAVINLSVKSSVNNSKSSKEFKQKNEKLQCFDFASLQKPLNGQTTVAEALRKQNGLNSTKNEKSQPMKFGSKVSKLNQHQQQTQPDAKAAYATVNLF